MLKGNVNTTQKEKRKKRTKFPSCEENNFPSSDSYPMNNISSEKDRKKFDLPNDCTKQSCKEIESSSTLRKFENYQMFEDNYNHNQDSVSLQDKIVELVKQRDDLDTYYRILSGKETNDYLKKINAQSLESEIADLKSMVRTLHKGLNIVLDEHSIMKHLVIDQLKDVNTLLEWNTVKAHPKNSYSFSNHPEKYVPPRFKESGFILKNINSNKKLIDIFGNSSNFNSPRFFDSFGNSDKNDSMAKFRQLAELKIIVEILQKYSRIVTDEFRSINCNVENNMGDLSESTLNGSVNLCIKNSCIETSESSKDNYVIHKNIIANEKGLDIKHKANVNTDLQNHLDRYNFEAVQKPKNHLKTTSEIYPGRLNFSSERSNLNAKSGITQDDLNSCDNKTTQGFVIEEKLKASTYVLKYKSKDSINNTYSNCVESNKREYSSFGAGSLLEQPFPRLENKLKTEKSCSSTLISSFTQNVTVSDKNRILFLSDSHGRYCCQFLQDELGSQFSVISVVKPDALFEEIIKDFYHLANSFSREDYVIICAGSTNFKCKDKAQSKIDFELVLPIFQHTNVILTRLPLLFDFPSLNSHIRRFNNLNSTRVFELARKNSNILPMPKFTFFSRNHPKQSIEFNKIGKKTYCKKLAKTIIYHSFIRKQKMYLHSQCNETIKSFASKISDINGSQSINNANKFKTSTTDDESTKNTENNQSKWETPMGSDQLNKHNHEANQQLKKSIKTQTSEEFLDSPLQLADKKVVNVNPKLHSVQEVTIISKNINEQHYCPQSVITEEHSNINGVVPFNYNSGDHNQRQGFFAGIFMKNNHANMTTIKELLGQGDIPKPKKNFIQENVKRLKELKLEKGNKLSSQRSKTLQPLTESKNAQTMVSSSRFSQRPSVSSQQSPSPPLRGRRHFDTSKHVTLDTQLPIAAMDENPKGYRSQGCQTLNGKQLENLYEEGVIRYPSVREMVSQGEGEAYTMREMGLQTEAPLEVLHPPPPRDDEEGLHWDEEKKAGDKDFVKMNATVPDPRRHKTPDVSSTDPTRAPPNYQRGVVPKYLREHKKEIERERINKVKDEECPEGHIQLPDDIKQKHLTTLRQNYADLVSQLNQLPVSTDTLRTRTRKKQIETDLDRIEAAIALFSREKVFVKADS